MTKNISKLLVIICIATAILFVSCKQSMDSRDSVAVAEHLRGLPFFISEVYSANPNYKDEFGKDPGWVEFYNPADTAINLNGYYLANGTDTDSERWKFGDVIVPPRGYMTVFMSKRDIPNYYPPSDSIDLLKNAAGVKTWASRLNTPTIRRRLSVLIRGFNSKASAKLSGNRSKFSGTVKVMDNPDLEEQLDWSLTHATLIFKDRNGMAAVDMSGVNQILLNGFITKGTRLEVRFLSSDIADGKAWATVITGTGVENGQYVIDFPLADDGFPNPAHIGGLRFGHDESFRGMIEFDFNSIIARRRGSFVHSSLSLRSKKGGELFLMDSEANVIDSVAYPEETLGLSYARNFETGSWAHSLPPTPNSANSAEFYEGGKMPPPSDNILPNSGHYAEPLSFTIPEGKDGSVIVCDMTGSLPVRDGELRSGATVNLTKTTIMRCAQFRDGGAYGSDPVMRTYIIGRQPDLPIVSIAVDPVDMFDSTHGLYSKGPNAGSAAPRYGANYWRGTELPVQIDFFENGVRHAWTYQAGLRISGGWSRMNAKKSVVISFRDIYGRGRLSYTLFPDNPELNRFKHIVLRCNGQNFGRDYIRDMLMSSLTEGLDIDYQRGRSVIVYYNGEYFGIYGLRERANADYFSTKYGLDQDSIDLVDVYNDIASQGSNADYQDVINWLEKLDGLSDDDLSALEQRVDIDNYTNQFISRMYYHDRDWPKNNMKRWRPHLPAARWKWLMQDTDHGWGSHGIRNQPDVGTMDFATAVNGPAWPNPPEATFLLRKLLKNDGYRNSFINRFSLIMATYFAPDRVNARIDALMTPIQSEIPFDQERWGHDVAVMNGQLDTIRTFNDWRRPQMQREIEEFFELGSGVNFTVSVDGNGEGKICVHNLDVMNGAATFKAYAAAPIALEAVPANGAVFEAWSDGVTEAKRIVTVAEGEPIVLRAMFKSSDMVKMGKNEGRK